MKGHLPAFRSRLIRAKAFAGPIRWMKRKETKQDHSSQLFWSKNRVVMTQERTNLNEDNDKAEVTYPYPRLRANGSYYSNRRRNNNEREPEEQS